MIIIDSTLRMFLPPQLKQMSARYKVMCGWECFIFAKSMHSSLLSWRDSYLKKLKIKVSMLRIEGLMKNQIAYMKHIKMK